MKNFLALFSVYLFICSTSQPNYMNRTLNTLIPTTKPLVPLRTLAKSLCPIKQKGKEEAFSHHVWGSLKRVSHTSSNTIDWRYLPCCPPWLLFYYLLLCLVLLDFTVTPALFPQNGPLRSWHCSVTHCSHGTQHLNLMSLLRLSTQLQSCQTDLKSLKSYWLSFCPVLSFNNKKNQQKQLSFWCFHF